MIWLILTLGLILRLVSLNQSFWLDEATSATVVKSFSFSDILTKFAPGDFHPPLYYLLLKAWTIPLGISEISTRLLSVLFALITVFVVYKIGLLLSEKKSEVSAALAAILMATAPLHVYYSQEARMYALETLLVSVSIYLFTKILKKETVLAWILFAFTLVLIGASDYLPLLIVPIFWLVGIIYKKSLNWFSKLILAHIPLALFFVYWLPTFIKQLSSGLSVRANSPGWWQILGKAGIKELALLPVKFMIGRISFDNKIVYGVVVMLLTALFGYLIFKAVKLLRKKSLQLDIIFIWLLVPVILAFILSFKLSVFSYFRLLFVLPAFYLIIAKGLATLNKKIFPILALIVIFINISFSLGYLLNPRFQREDWRGVATKIGDSPVVFPAKSQREAFLYYNPKPNIIEPEKLNKTSKEFYLMRYVSDIFDPNDLVRKKIEDLGYKKTDDYDFNGVIVWKYEKH